MLRLTVVSSNFDGMKFLNPRNKLFHRQQNKQHSLTVRRFEGFEREKILVSLHEIVVSRRAFPRTLSGGRLQITKRIRLDLNKMQAEAPIVDQPLTRKNAANLQEYLLQGSIMDNAVDVLLNRLRGLCDNSDSPVEMFHDIEQVYAFKDQTNQAQFSLRARNALDNPQLPWQLRYVGQPEVGDKSRFTICRSVIEVGTSSNLVTWLNELGFRLDYEFVAKGHIFQKGRMKILVQKIYRVCQSGNPESLEPVSQSYLIELSVLAPPSQESLGEEMKAFADQLKPLVELEKIDHARLQIM